MPRKLVVLVLSAWRVLSPMVEAFWNGQHFHPGWLGWLGGYRYSFVQDVVLSPGGHVRPPDSGGGSEARVLVPG